MTDFLILEYNTEIGGRVKNVKFGTNPNTGGNYTVEVGANWVSYLGHSENPSPVVSNRYLDPRYW